MLAASKMASGNGNGGVNRKALFNLDDEKVRTMMRAKTSGESIPLLNGEAKTERTDYAKLYNVIFVSGEEKGAVKGRFVLYDCLDDYLEDTNNHYSNPMFEDDMGYLIDRDIAVMKACVGVGYYKSKQNSASKNQSPVTRAAKKTAVFKKSPEAIKLISATAL
ncbi:hypothetical protein BJ508DRAFT_302415 [Ascobolus immersus RN42]|uniref:Uncharacterized protein n=1 Tax=Ascobolus immersus RN42 TaxID=1160509 RepID=A0A3N4IK49_ASCIM|nr:hypothetical protein BJ508DRAFT_302415 [Ascobolus immersus RN42]